VDFKNSVITMTSNIGSEYITFDKDPADVQQYVMDAQKAHFRPEFLNRVDEMVVFHSLSKEEMAKILDILLAEVQLRLKERDMGFTITKTGRDFLIDKGFDPRYGARPLRRIIQQEIEEVLSMELLRHRFEAGDRILVSARGGKLTFSRGKKEENPDAPGAEDRSSPSSPSSPPEEELAPVQ
jgi:ATP-dependent Clp protease ATP-binding subunit ClpA